MKTKGNIRKVLAVPLDEVYAHFTQNARQDVKIVAPEILTGELIARLAAAGRAVKPEELLHGIAWRHSEGDGPNALCEAHEFAADLDKKTHGPFALCFANEKSPQDTHYHPHHLEIYFSEHLLEAEFHSNANSPVERVRLENGGVLVFAAGVVHRARLGGMTMVIEIPAVKHDKVVTKL